MRRPRWAPWAIWEGHLAQREVVASVLPAQPLGLAAGLQQIQWILVDRLQHAEARLACGALLLLDKALIHECRHAVDDTERQVALTVSSSAIRRSLSQRPNEAISCINASLYTETIARTWCGGAARWP